MTSTTEAPAGSSTRSRLRTIAGPVVLVATLAAASAPWWWPKRATHPIDDLSDDERSYLVDDAKAFDPDVCDLEDDGADCPDGWWILDVIPGSTWCAAPSSGVEVGRWLVREECPNSGSNDDPARWFEVEEPALLRTYPAVVLQTIDDQRLLLVVDDDRRVAFTDAESSTANAVLARRAAEFGAADGIDALVALGAPAIDLDT